MGEKKDTATTANSDGTIRKAILMEGGRFVIETDVTNLSNVMFSVRGEVDFKNIQDVFKMANEFFLKLINDSKHSGKC